MSSIFILKEILDLLYEESKRGELVTTDIENRIRTLEKQLEEKNKELSRLYTENIRLENSLKRYESEFEILSKMPIIPAQTPIETQTKNENENSVISESVKPDSEKNQTPKTESESESEKKESVKPDSEKTEHEKEKEKEKRKQNRREYMAEYQRNYRKMKKEQKTELNV